MIVEIARDRVRDACDRPENAFGKAFYQEHIQVMHDYALALADRTGADKEIVELAAYLHDVAAVLLFASLPRHPEEGAVWARRFLKEQAYPEDRIERVAKCILSHSAPVDPVQASLEEVCISNADAMSQIARPAYWLYYGFNVRKFGYEEGRVWWRDRVRSHWSALRPEARALVADPYRLTCALLEMDCEA